MNYYFSIMNLNKIIHCSNFIINKECLHVIPSFIVSFLLLTVNNRKQGINQHIVTTAFYKSTKQPCAPKSEVVVKQIHHQKKKCMPKLHLTVCSEKMEQTTTWRDPTMCSLKPQAVVRSCVLCDQKQEGTSCQGTLTVLKRQYPWWPSEALKPWRQQQQQLGVLERNEFFTPWQREQKKNPPLQIKLTLYVTVNK